LVLYPFYDSEGDTIFLFYYICRWNYSPEYEVVLLWGSKMYESNSDILFLKKGLEPIPITM